MSLRKLNLIPSEETANDYMVANSGLLECPRTSSLSYPSIHFSLHSLPILCITSTLACFHCHKKHHPLSSLWQKGLSLSKCSASYLIKLFILYNHSSDLIGENLPFFLRLGQVPLFCHFLALNIFPFPVFSYIFIFAIFQRIFVSSLKF